MKDASTKNGCLFVTGKGKAKNQKTGKMEDVDYFCMKIQAEESTYCPKHLLLVLDHEAAYKRRAAKSAATREHKRTVSEALEASPLKAHNPKFDTPNETGYSR